MGHAYVYIDTDDDGHQNWQCKLCGCTMELPEDECVRSRTKT